MKRLLLLAGVAAAVGSTSLMAQETAKPHTMTKDTITVTGCLQTGTAADTFTLSNVTQAAAASSATGTAGTATATASASGSPKTTDAKYELVAGGNVNLKPHVGHKVEVTGTPAKATAGTSGATTPPPAASSGTSMAETKKITVTAVKHVAATCP
jgi:hypothetical protein